MTESHIGKTLYVASAIPATNDAAGFAALTWVKVSGIVAGPQFGVTHNNIDVPDLQTGFTTGLKGAGTGNDSTFSFRDVDGDAGQAAVKAAAEAGGNGSAASIKLVKGSGTNQAPVAGDPVEYAQGYLHSYVENVADDASYEGASVNFKQNALTVSATHPA